MMEGRRLVALLFLLPAAALTQGTMADYQRAAAVQKRWQPLVVDSPDAPVWIVGTSRFWYRKTVKGGNAFVLVDAAVPEKKPAFDHERLAAGIGAATHKTVTAVTLPFTTFTIADDSRVLSFMADSVNWNCTLAEYQCSRGATTAAGGGRGGRGGGAGGAFGAATGGNTAANMSRPSPDAKQVAFIDNYNIAVRQVGSTEGTRISTDGSEGDPYTLQSIAWSPNSRMIAAYRVRPGYRRMVRYVESSPADQLQPKTFERYYQKPGDVLDLQQPSFFDVATKRETVVDNALFPNPYDLSRIEWRKDSRAFTFEYNQRGHQLYRVLEVDASSGRVRAVVTETSNTFVDYRRANVGLADSGRQFRFDLDDGNEFIWMSERDGWAHLYLWTAPPARSRTRSRKGTGSCAACSAWTRPTGRSCSARRHEPETGSVFPPVLPDQLRRQRAHAAHRRRRLPHGHVLTGQRVLRRYLVTRGSRAGLATAPHERREGAHGARARRRHGSGEGGMARAGGVRREGRATARATSGESSSDRRTSTRRRNIR